MEVGRGHRVVLAMERERPSMAAWLHGCMWRSLVWPGLGLVWCHTFGGMGARGKKRRRAGRKRRHWLMEVQLGPEGGLRKVYSIHVLGFNVLITESQHHRPVASRIVESHRVWFLAGSPAWCHVDMDVCNLASRALASHLIQMRRQSQTTQQQDNTDQRTRALGLIESRSCKDGRTTFLVSAASQPVEQPLRFCKSQMVERILSTSRHRLPSRRFTGADVRLLLSVCNVGGVWYSRIHPNWAGWSI